MSRFVVNRHRRSDNAASLNLHGASPVNLRVFLHVLLLTLVVLVAPARAEDRVLYEKPSLFGTIVVTEDESGLRALRFSRNGPRQSVVKPGDPDYLELPYARTALVGLALADEPRRALIIGLGGGTLPMILRKHYPEAAIDVVDIDPQVVDAAQKFFGFREDASLHVHIADGRKFIEQVQQPYDVIILDAYGSDSVPLHLTTQEFLRAVRGAIKPGGVVISNIWAPQFNPIYDSMVRTYQETFEETYTLDALGSGNVIVLALPRPQSITAGDLAQRAHQISVSRGFRNDLGDPTQFRLLHAQQKNPRVTVLRDADVKLSR